MKRREDARYGRPRVYDSVPEVPGVATVLQKGTSTGPMVAASLFRLVASHDDDCPRRILGVPRFSVVGYRDNRV